MQDRRYRPGDVLDDYCPRERRITDHAIVAIVEDEIRRTRCGSCDAEHEYKEGKVPAPRRKTPQPALFTQVLEGMNGTITPPAPSGAGARETLPSGAGVREASPPGAVSEAVAVAEPDAADAAAVARSATSDIETEPVMMAAASKREKLAAVSDPQPASEAPAAEDGEPTDDPEREGGFRRSLIRATFPRPEGQAPPPRAVPEFTIQSLHNRRNNNGQRHAGGANKFRGGRRRPAGGGSQDNLGPMRFRDGGHSQGQGGQGQGQGQGGGRRRRGGKKNR